MNFSVIHFHDLRLMTHLYIVSARRIAGITQRLIPSSFAPGPPPVLSVPHYQVLPRRMVELLRSYNNAPLVTPGPRTVKQCELNSLLGLSRRHTLNQIVKRAIEDWYLSS